jgi:anti-sigma28 factor (negative regulator of flagellin synthesis)
MEVARAMEEDFDKKVARLRDQLERGNYNVDPGAVADAILKRLRDFAAVRP